MFKISKKKTQQFLFYRYIYVYIPSAQVDGFSERAAGSCLLSILLKSGYRNGIFPKGPASASKSKAAKNQSKKSEAAKKPSTTPKKSPEPVEPKTNLTDKLIREMSIYFALAIQRNPESLEDMKKEVWAGFLHKISTDDHPQHDSCNIEWCNYLINTATGEPFVHPPPSTRKFKKLSKKFTLHYPMKIFLLDAWEKTIKIPTSHTTLAFGSLHQSTTTQAKTS